LIFFEEDVVFTLVCDFINNNIININNIEKTCFVCNILKKPCMLKYCGIHDIYDIYKLNKHDKDSYIDLIPYQHFSFSSINNYVKSNGYMIYYQEHVYFSYDNTNYNYDNYNTISYLCVKNLENLKLKSKCYFNFKYLKNINTININITLETNRMSNIIKILILHLISSYSCSTSISINRNNIEKFLLSIGFEKEDFNISDINDIINYEEDNEEYYEKEDELEDYYKKQENIKDINEYLNFILNDENDVNDHHDFDEENKWVAKFLMRVVGRA